jgi:hypothetical protein
MAMNPWILQQLADVHTADLRRAARLAPLLAEAHPAPRPRGAARGGPGSRLVATLTRRRAQPAHDGARVPARAPEPHVG